VCVSITESGPSFSQLLEDVAAAVMCFLFVLRDILRVSPQFNGHFSSWTWVSWYQNVFILDLLGANDDGNGGDNRSYNRCKAPVK